MSEAKLEPCPKCGKPSRLTASDGQPCLECFMGWNGDKADAGPPEKLEGPLRVVELPSCHALHHGGKFDGPFDEGIPTGALLFMLLVLLALIVDTAAAIMYLAERVRAW